jgi:anti-sigma regulatory factor (Ser/Thr protein kinase)
VSARGPARLSLHTRRSGPWVRRLVSGHTPLVNAHLSLHPDPVEVATARRFVVDTLTRWRLTQDLDTVVLLASELVANAVMHAGTDIVLTLSSHARVLTVEVSDGSAQAPVRRAAVPATATDGRGLNLIADLSDDWGFRTVPSLGKVVWFSLDERAPVGPRA